MANTDKPTKAVVASIVASASSLLASLPGLSAAEIVGAVVSAAVAFGGVYGVTNRPRG